MRNSLLIELSPEELMLLLRNLIQDESNALRQEIALLRSELSRNRDVVTLKQATAYFDEYVKPETVLSYIHYEGLPATKKGRLWFIYLNDLLDWQIGLIGHASTKKEGIKKIAPPRHHRRNRGRFGIERTREPIQTRDESILTRDSKPGQKTVTSPVTR